MMAEVLERTYTIPLRRQWRKTVRYRRAKKTITAIKEFLQKHMKTETVKIGHHLNRKVWEHGMKNPPSKVRITAYKDKKGIVTCELFGKPLHKTAVVEEKKGIAAKLKDAVTTKKDTPKTTPKVEKEEVTLPIKETQKSEAPSETLKEEKSEIKEITKEEQKEEVTKVIPKASELAKEIPKKSKKDVPPKIEDALSETKKE